MKLKHCLVFVQNYKQYNRYVIFFCRTIADHCEQVEEHASVKQLKLNSENETSITLEKCFDVSYFTIKFIRFV